MPMTGRLTLRSGTGIYDFLQNFAFPWVVSPAALCLPRAVRIDLAPLATVLPPLSPLTGRSPPGLRWTRGGMPANWGPTQPQKN